MNSITGGMSFPAALLSSASRLPGGISCGHFRSADPDTPSGDHAAAKGIARVCSPVCHHGPYCGRHCPAGFFPAAVKPASGDLPRRPFPRTITGERYGRYSRFSPVKYARTWVSVNPFNQQAHVAHARKKRKNIQMGFKELQSRLRSIDNRVHSRFYFIYSNSMFRYIDIIL